MEYLYIATAVILGAVICAALYVAILSYKKINGNMNLIVRLVHHSSKEITSVGTSVDAVIEQNQMALEQQRKSSDHQRVLLASLNRQLVTLETMFDRKDNNKSKKVTNTASAAEASTNNVMSRAEKLKQAIKDAPAQTNVRAPRAAVRLDQQAARVARMPAEAYQETQREPASAAQNPARPLNTRVAQQTNEQKTGAKISLAQRLRLQKHMEAQMLSATIEKHSAQASDKISMDTNQTPTAPPVSSDSAMRRREAIDMLKANERRVVNG